MVICRKYISADNVPYYDFIGKNDTCFARASYGLNGQLMLCPYNISLTAEEFEDIAKLFSNLPRTVTYERDFV